MTPRAVGGLGEPIASALQSDREDPVTNACPNRDPERRNGGGYAPRREAANAKAGLVRLTMGRKRGRLDHDDERRFGCWRRGWFLRGGERLGVGHGARRLTERIDTEAHHNGHRRAKLLALESSPSQLAVPLGVAALRAKGRSSRRSRRACECPRPAYESGSASSGSTFGLGGRRRLLRSPPSASSSRWSSMAFGGATPPFPSRRMHRGDRTTRSSRPRENARTRSTGVTRTRGSSVSRAWIGQGPSIPRVMRARESSALVGKPTMHSLRHRRRLLHLLLRPRPRSRHLLRRFPRRRTCQRASRARRAPRRRAP